jgi:hypothetical protein
MSYLFSFGLFVLSQRYCPKSDPRLRRKFRDLGFSQKVTKGTKVLAETFRFFTEGDEKTGNPPRPVGFLQKGTKARKEQAKFKLHFPSGILYRRKRRQ